VEGAASGGGTGGDAALVANLGAKAANASDGTSSLTVGKNMLVSGGEGRTANGGDAAVEFDSVDVGGLLEVVNGARTGSYTGGSSSFKAKTLKAATVDLTRNDGGTGSLAFSADQLIVTDRNTSVLVDDNTSLASPVAVFNAARVGNGHALSFFNKDGAVEVGTLAVPPGESASIYSQDSDNLRLGDLDVHGAQLTFLFDADTDPERYLAPTGTVNLDGAVLILSGDGHVIDGLEDYKLVDASGGTLLPGDYTVAVDPSSQTLAVVSVPDVDRTAGGPVITRMVRSNNPATKAFSEGKAAGHAFLVQGADLAAGDGVSNAVSAAADAGPSLFSAFSYSHSRYETGSHVDVDGFSFLIGATFGTDVSFGRFVFGAFFEYGDGNDDSYNDFAAFSVDGSGDASYAGGGLLARLEFARSESGTSYAEISGRAGSVSTDFASDSIPNYGHVTYDVKSSYWGAHLGIGRVFNVSESTTLDLYAKWLITHQSSESVVIEGETVSFDAITSNRLRGGVRVSTALTDYVKPYFGAAYEHETDGDASATSRGLNLQTPSTGGGTGIGEIGLTVLPADGFSIDVGVQGYIGQRQGISGSLRFVYSF
jgi:hypothetical protein